MICGDLAARATSDALQLVLAGILAVSDVKLWTKSAMARD